MPNVTIIGAGLAGSEAAWQAAELGCSVELWEMRPLKETPAHRTVLRRTRVLELARKPRPGDGLGTAQGRVAASWVGDPTLRRRQPGPRGRCSRGCPRGLPPPGHRDTPGSP